MAGAAGAPGGRVRIGMSTLDRLRVRKHEINRLAERHGAYSVRLFGSVVRGEDQAKKRNR